MDGDALTIRPAAAADAERITEIYNEGIAEREATFETRPREAAEILAWLDDGHPVLVAEHAGEVVGFARVNQYSDRCALAGIGEQGVYVDPPARRAGIGRALLVALADAAAETGYHKLLARIFTTNEASIAVHRAAGYREVGVQLRHGVLDGEWRDCVLMERLIGPASDRGPRSET